MNLINLILKQIGLKGQTQNQISFWYSEKVIICLLFLGNIAIRLFRINDPSFAYFDESKFYLPAARSLISSGIDSVWEHPPLAKLLIALGVKLFGDNSFGWRIAEVLIASLGAVVVYLLARKIFKSKVVAILAAVFLSIDFAWFTTSRLAIPEIFFASFILLSTYFFWKFNSEKNRRFWNLLLASIFWGFALATKWAAVFILPVYLIFALSNFPKPYFRVFKLGFIFLLLGSLVYLASYFFYFQKQSLKDFLVLQGQMYSYHSSGVNKIVEQNPKLREQEKDYKALFWPLNNIFSFRFEEKNETIKAVVFFYNPLVLWGGLVSVGYYTATWFRKRKIEKEKVFLIAAFLIFWIPWLFSPRIVYPYYWLAGVPFATILLAKIIEERWEKDKYVVVGFGVLSIVLFCLYYPILANWPVKNWYFQLLTGTVGFN